MKPILKIIIFIFISSNIAAQPLILSDSVPAGVNYNVAAFKLWIGNTKEKLKGILVLVPGSNSDGRSIVEEKYWQHLAEQYDLALLGCYFTDLPHEEMAIEEYAKANEGSGEALLKSLITLAIKAQRPELAEAPLFLWGHSAGGQFNYEFVCWKPNRVKAFVVNKGGIYYTALATKESRNVPGIFFTGEDDLKFRSDIIKGIYAINRRFGALWTFAEEPNVGHDIGNTQKLSGIFFESILQKTNIKDASTFTENNGYVGDWRKKKYVPYVGWKQKEYPESWLPTKEFADAWLAFITGKKF